MDDNEEGEGNVGAEEEDRGSSSQDVDEQEAFVVAMQSASSDDEYEQAEGEELRGGEGGSGDERETERADDTNSDEEAEQFDISLAASHSYMGPGLQPVSGRVVLEAGWRGRLRVVAHHGAVFPGETVPMLLPHHHDASTLHQAIHEDKLFGLLCPDETGTMVSGYGVVCEIFEASLSTGAEEEPPTALTFKARATHRFRFASMPKQDVPMHLYSRMRQIDIVILPELQPAPALLGVRLAALDPLRRRTHAHTHAPHPLDRRLRSMDAAVTSWPLFVYEIFDYGRMRAIIEDYFKTMMLDDKLPSEPVSLSYWVARNLPLSARDRIALFVVDNALLRLYMEVKDIRRKSVLCCGSCATEIARKDHIFAMSSEGVHSNYTNLGGYMHDIVTVSSTVNTELSGAPSAEFSWFPGYTWTIALCAGCMVHVGWRFDAQKRSLRPQQFYGLCRNYVQPRAADQAPLPPLAPCSLAPRRPPAAHAHAD